MPLEIVTGAVVGAAAVTFGKKIRTGLVWGLAGILKAYDAVVTTGSGIIESAKDIAAEAKAKSKVQQVTSVEGPKEQKVSVSE